METATETAEIKQFPPMTRMTRIFNPEAFLAKLEISDDVDIQTCQICYGTGLEVVPGPKGGARKCICKTISKRDEFVATIPERNKRYGLPALHELMPFLPKEHEEQPLEVKMRIGDFQKKVIGFVQKNPFHSINLCGKNKIGKSQIAFALLTNAFDARRNVKFFKLADLLADYAKAARQAFGNGDGEEAYKMAFTPRLTVQNLNNYTAKYTILIDEFHNPILSFTESQIRTTFEILDAIKANGHQLILLSNYPWRQLREGMYARKAKLGEGVTWSADAILSRISEEAVTEELFF